MEAYADEPLANTEWLAEYEKKQISSRKRSHELEERLELVSTVNLW